MPKRQRRRFQPTRRSMNEARRVQSMLGVLFVVIAALAIGVGVWLRLTPAPPPAPPKPPSEAKIYIPRVDAQGEPRYEAKSVRISSPQTAYEEVFEQLVRQSDVFPSGTRLLSATAQGSTLQLNFSRELVENFAGGSAFEAPLINAITRTAGSFPDIERVQILVEGKPVETLGGHIDISQALPVMR
ncbi:MAG: GerMN domain-containing protein [Fimbriimonadales bacterium]|nr:GerMN domain-containing protein [Fimbriimonadales bacterium]